MNKIGGLYSDLNKNAVQPNPQFNKNSEVAIADQRIARLLIVLHELDESLGALDRLPQAELSELVSSAIAACGFKDRVDASYAIAAVLETISASDSRTESS